MPYSKIHASKVGLLVLTSVFMTVKSPAYANDLMEVYAQAENNNIELQSSLTDFSIVQQSRNEIASEYDSSLSLNIKPTYVFGEEGISDRTAVDYSFSFNKPLYQQQINARLSQADLSIQREQVVLSAQKQELISQIAKAYIEFASAQNSLEVSLSEQDIIRRNLNEVNALFKKKETTITEVTELQLRLNQSLITLTEANLELSNARRELHILTGQSYSVLPTLDDNAVLPPLQPSQLNEWSKLATLQNPELLTAQLDHDIQKKEIRIEQTADGTSLDLFASYEGEAGIDDSEQDSRVGKVGLEINIPLYSGGRTIAKVRSAKLQQQKTHLALDSKRREVTQNIALEYLTVKAGLENLRALKRASLETEKVLATIKREKTAGTQTEADVLAFSEEAISSKRSYVEARYKFLTDLVSLKLTAGVLSMSDLKTISTLFRPGRNLKSQPVLADQSSIVQARNKGVSLEDVWNLN